MQAPFTSAEAGLAQGRWAKYLRSEIATTNTIGMKFSLIPPGVFQQGNLESVTAIRAAYPKLNTWNPADFENAPKHQVEITQPFFLSQYEVTVGQFKRFVEATDYQTDAEKGRWVAIGVDPQTGQPIQDARFNWRNTFAFQGNEHPVVNVSHNDAVTFCRWLSEMDDIEYSLPTEAEWEYSCRAGTITRFSHGNSAELLPQFANTWDESTKRLMSTLQRLPHSDGFALTSPVGTFRPNPFGLYDMHGNVVEWCADWYAANYYRISRLQDPRNDSASGLRALRGGSWNNHAAYCRSAYRFYTEPESAYHFIGFRVRFRPEH